MPPEVCDDAQLRRLKALEAFAIAEQIRSAGRCFSGSVRATSNWPN